jgi:hypothetical protein
LETPSQVIIDVDTVLAVPTSCQPLVLTESRCGTVWEDGEVG